jgi:hypothetical protein
VAEHKVDLLISAEIGKPIPGENAFHADDKVFAEGLNRL